MRKQGVQSQFGHLILFNKKPLPDYVKVADSRGYFLHWEPYFETKTAKKASILDTAVTKGN